MSKSRKLVGSTLAVLVSIGYSLGFYFTIQCLIKISEDPSSLLSSIAMISLCSASLVLSVWILKRLGLMGPREFFAAHGLSVLLAVSHYRGTTSEVAVGFLGSLIFGAPLSLIAFKRG